MPFPRNANRVTLRIATQGSKMRRRDFIAGIGGVASYPLVGQAQQTGKVARIGFLGPPSASDLAFADYIATLKAGLRDLGYIEGSNFVIEYRWADGIYSRFPILAAELVRSKVDLMITQGTTGTIAAKQATTSIPILMINVGDPVASGLVTSLARPGGNITGLSAFSPEVHSKRIELLPKVLPYIARVAALFNADSSINRKEFQAMEQAAKLLKVEIKPYPVRGPAEFKSAFDTMAHDGIEAVEISDDITLNVSWADFAALSLERRLPSVGMIGFVRAGGLIGYGVPRLAMYRRAAALVDKILRGTKPADIPIEQPTMFELALNRTTAKALGIIIPEALLATADEVIE
jgi:putative tryptophan/tyrosine transport system substrate-binding protein